MTKISIPHHPVHMRSDILIVSEAIKPLILLGLTVPWEEGMEEAQERKRAKYQELVEFVGGREGWKTKCMPVEVGGGGSTNHSLHKAYETLGVTGASRRRAISNHVEAAEKASRWLRLKRGEQRGQQNAIWTRAEVCSVLFGLPGQGVSVVETQKTR